MNWHICHKKNTFFVHIFDISPYVFPQISIGRACWMWNLIPSNEYPHYILLMDPTIPKTLNTWKKCDDDVIITFFRYFYFWGSRVCDKYAAWVLVGCKIEFHIQQALLIKIWVKTKGDMSKIQTQKVVFFFLRPKLINIILLFSLGGPF